MERATGNNLYNTSTLLRILQNRSEVLEIIGRFTAFEFLAGSVAICMVFTSGFLRLFTTVRHREDEGRFVVHGDISSDVFCSNSAMRLRRVLGFLEFDL